jgi:hypothetical protein
MLVQSGKQDSIRVVQGKIGYAWQMSFWFLPKIQESSCLGKKWAVVFWIKKQKPVFTKKTGLLL